ncbi:MAG: hypothetical protein ACHQU0_01640 [Candidatus Paceibacteria bacterium]
MKGFFVKIVDEIPEVKIVRCRTIAEALIRGGFHPQKVDLVSGLIHGTFHPTVTASADVLYEPLAKEHEGDMEYCRTCAIASLDAEMTVSELYRALDKAGYYPASISEGASYLSMHMVENVMHLGTLIRDERYQEYRLFTRGNGKVEFVPFYSATKLKAYYKIVVVKKEGDKKR